jgi:hypothetical protein
MTIDLKSYKIFDFMEFIIGFLAVTSSILGIVTFAKNNIEGNILFSIISPFVLCILFLIKISKIWKVSYCRLHSFSESFHKLTDLIRDEFFQLKKRLVLNELSAEFLLQTLQKTSQQSVDCLANCLTLSTGKQVFATIKYFDNGSINSSQITDEMKVVTLCRSSNQSQERIANDKPSKIIDNTDFYEIVKNSRAHFAASNLQTHSWKIKAITGDPYKNSNANWNDHYSTTIVVPIRIQRKHIDVYFNDDGYDIVGFLCVDATSTSTFRDSDIKAYINLVKSFADCLYKYFDRFLYYQGLLINQKKEGNYALESI